MHLLGHFVGRQTASHMLANLLSAQYGAMRQHHHGHHSFAGLVVWLGKHRSLHQRRVLQEAGLDFCSGNLFTGAVDHILDAVNDAHIAIGVLDPNVAGMEPAAFHCPCSLFWLTAVLLHHGHAAQPDFTGLTQRQRGAVKLRNAHLDDGRRQARSIRAQLEQSA